MSELKASMVYMVFPGPVGAHETISKYLLVGKTGIWRKGAPDMVFTGTTEDKLQESVYFYDVDSIYSLNSVHWACPAVTY